MIRGAPRHGLRHSRWPRTRGPRHDTPARSPRAADADHPRSLWLALGAAIGFWQIEQSRQDRQRRSSTAPLAGDPRAIAIVGDVARSGGAGTRSPADHARPFVEHLGRPCLLTTSTRPTASLCHRLHPRRRSRESAASAPCPPKGWNSFDVTYNRRPVPRPWRPLTDTATLRRHLGGIYTYTVWQEIAVRDRLPRRTDPRHRPDPRRDPRRARAGGSGSASSWACAHLVDLEDAVSQRGLDDLSPIQRPVAGRGAGPRAPPQHPLRTGDNRRWTPSAQLISNARPQAHEPDRPASRHSARPLRFAHLMRCRPAPATDELVRSARHAIDTCQPAG